MCVFMVLYFLLKGKTTIRLENVFKASKNPYFIKPNLLGTLLRWEFLTELSIYC